MERTFLSTCASPEEKLYIFTVLELKSFVKGATVIGNVFISKPILYIPLALDSNMYDVCYEKFTNNDALHLKERLLKTGKEELVEGNTWHDNYWGNCTCEKCKNIAGQNKLGKS